MGTPIGRRWALPLLLAVVAQLAGPLLSSAAAFPVSVRVPVAVSPMASDVVDDLAPVLSEPRDVAPGTAEPESSPEPEDDCPGCPAEPEGQADGEAGVVAEGPSPIAEAAVATEHGDCAAGEPADAAAVACAEDFAGCASETPGSAAECVTNLGAGLAAIVARALGCEPAIGDCLPPDDSPCEDETNLQCQLERVLDENCPEEPDGPCGPVYLVIGCLDPAETAPACTAETVAGFAKQSICGAVPPEDEPDEDEPDGEEPSCQERLETCGEPAAEACQEALRWLRERAAATACDAAKNDDACAVLVQVGDILDCDDTLVCAFAAVWEPAVPVICGQVAPPIDEEGEEENGHCEDTLGACELPGTEECAEAAEYLADRAEATACADAMLACALRDCAVNGSSLRCAEEVVIDQVCGDEDDCAARGDVIVALLDAQDSCAAVDSGACESSLRSLAVAALHETCRTAPPLGSGDPASESPCHTAVAGLEPCVDGSATCDQAYLEQWAQATCLATPSLITACPVKVHVKDNSQMAADQRHWPPSVGNGSQQLPYHTIALALAAVRGADPLSPTAEGPLVVQQGNYQAFNVPASGYRIGEGGVLEFQPASGVVIDGGGGSAVTVAGEHPFVFTGAVTLIGGLAGPVSSAGIAVGASRVYVGRSVDVVVTARNRAARIPEPVQRHVTVSGSLGSTSGALELQATWHEEPTVENGQLSGVLQQSEGAWVPTTWDDTETITVIPRSPGTFRVRLDLVGVHTGWVYASATSATVEAGNLPAPATPPPGVPRTEEDDLPKAVRLSGEDRAATAASVSRSSFPDGASQAFVATGQSYADALAAGPAAVRTGSPVVLVERDRVPDATQAEIERLRPDLVSLLGGTSAISAEVEAQIKALGPDVSRLRGDSRYSTAAAVSRAHFGPGVPVAYIASGEGFADALSGGAAAAALGSPVLLVQRDAVPAATEEELRRLRPARLVVLGGRQAISDAVESQLRPHADDVRRVSGPTRYATSAAVSRDAFPGTAETVFVATGAAFADALAGVPAAGAQRAPLLLVEPDRLPAEVAAELDRLRPGQIVILGGERSVSQRLERELRSYQTR